MVTANWAKQRLLLDQADDFPLPALPDETVVDSPDRPVRRPAVIVFWQCIGPSVATLRRVSWLIRNPPRRRHERRPGGVVNSVTDWYCETYGHGDAGAHWAFRNSCAS